MQHALGTSTMPAMRPSHGQQLSRRMICTSHWSCEHGTSLLWSCCYLACLAHGSGEINMTPRSAPSTE